MADPNQKPKTPPTAPPTDEAPVADIPQANAPAGRPTVKTAGGPVIPDGDVTIVPPPVVLVTDREFDPANPAGAKRIEATGRSEYRKELDALLLKEPGDLTKDDLQRRHELHYLVNGQDVPAK